MRSGCSGDGDGFASGNDGRVEFEAEVVESGKTGPVHIFDMMIRDDKLFLPSHEQERFVGVLIANRY